MYLLGWFAVGFIVASVVMYLGRQRDRGTVLGEPSLTATVLASALLFYAVWSRSEDKPSAPAANKTAPAPTGRGLASAKLTFLLIVSVLLLWFAVASDQAGLPQSVAWLRSLFLGVRFQYLFWGAVLGVLTQIFREPIGKTARQALDATIGSKEGTAWVLQGTLALLIVAVGVFVIKPDLLTYLRSFEYGGFKATFADHSTITRSAGLDYKDLLWGFTLEQYGRESFGPNFVNADSDRAYFGDRFFDSKVSEERRNITDALFKNYAEPLIGSLICLESHHTIRVAAVDEGLIKYGATWLIFLTRLKAEPSKVDINSVQHFLESIGGFRNEAAVYVNRIVPDCMVPRTVTAEEISSDAKKISENYHKGLRKLEVDKAEPGLQTLAMIEPYLVAAVGDLIVVLNGQKEKAEFLTKMLDGFPHSNKLMTPGILNIFYQTADAQLKSLESWPPEAILANVNFAIRCVDALITKSTDLVVVYDDMLAKLKRDEKPDPRIRNPKGFFDSMNRNLLILLSEKLALFNQRVLAGEALSQSAHDDWLRTYGRMIANLSVRSDAPIVTLDNLPPEEVNKHSKEILPFIAIEPQYLVDIDIATAISSVLLEQSQGKTTALSCNSALYYLKAAATNVEQFLKAERHEAEKKQLADQKQADARTAITELKLKRILAIIRNWAGAYCDWTPDPA